MKQSDQLVSILKTQLKANAKTYVDVAKVLDLSEASVKRLFSERNISLQRLEQIAELAGLQLVDLFALLNREQQLTEQLNIEQERILAEDVELMLVALNVINGYKFQDLICNYDISEAHCIRKLAALDKLGILELMPNNRIKLKVSPNFSWLPNGPIQRFFQEKVEDDFFSSSFDRDAEKLTVLNAILTRETNAELQKRMLRWAREFNELMQRDVNVPMEKRKGTTMVIALREWQYSLFQRHARNAPPISHRLK